MGLWLSWLWNLPSGASIVLFAAALFFAGYAFRTLRDRRSPSPPLPPVPS
jgi:ABC-type Mn2+/Zn2+ transport system permease subunit